MEFRVGKGVDTKYIVACNRKEFYKNKIVKNVLENNPDAMFFIHEKRYIIYSTEREVWNYFASITSIEDKFFLKQITVPVGSGPIETTQKEFVRFKTSKRIDKLKLS
jgi:hypothetical protein